MRFALLKLWLALSSLHQQDSQTLFVPVTTNQKINDVNDQMTQNISKMQHTKLIKRTPFPHPRSNVFALLSTFFTTQLTMRSITLLPNHTSPISPWSLKFSSSVSYCLFQLKQVSELFSFNGLKEVWTECCEGTLFTLTLTMSVFQALMTCLPRCLCQNERTHPLKMCLFPSFNFCNTLWNDN